jgi:hypothetical protein
MKKTSLRCFSTALALALASLAPACSAPSDSAERPDREKEVVDEADLALASCPYQSIQTRVQPNIDTPWTQTLTLQVGQIFRVGGFYNGTGLLAPSGVTLTVTGPGGFYSAPANGVYLIAPLPGTYTVRGVCGNLSESATVSLVAPPSCTCPDGTDSQGNPVTGTYCGQTVCGADFQYYSCETAGWQAQGGTCGAPSCTCPDGTDSQGNPVTGTYCGQTVCGADFQYYSCETAGWQAQGGTCGT